MNVLKSVLVIPLFFFHLSQAQDSFSRNPETGIIRSSGEDTSFLKIEYKGAQYDGQRANLPYLPLSKVTQSEQSAKAVLLIQSVSAVTEPHASVIRKYYASYLGEDFALEAQSSICIRENLNLHRLIPFRINKQNQVEELTSFEISWQTMSNPNEQEYRHNAAFKIQSVLADGDWYKLAVTKTGLHMISRDQLQSLGIAVNTIDPRNIRLYGNGGKMLPETNGSARYDDLEENAILVQGENDGVFDNQDFILFYATGPDEWKSAGPASGLKFEAVKNLYSDSSFYFITIANSPGKRMNTMPASPAVPNTTTSTYDYYAFHEEEKVNFAKSGRDFYGEYFDFQNQYTFAWNDGEFVAGDSIFAKVTMAAIYTDTTQFLLNGNGLNGILTTPSLNVGAYLADYARVATKTFKAKNTDPNVISLTITKLMPKSVGYLDKLTVNARRNIRLISSQFQFRDTRTTGPGKVCHYILTAPKPSSTILLNVTDPINPILQQFNVSGTSMEFDSPSNTLNEFSICSDNDYYRPVLLGKISNQNLHGILQADYVIVSHPLFMNQAARLASFHNKAEGYTSAVVNVEQVYNEFSSGRQDISAIRDFIRMLYERNIASGKQVKYVLLMGDGSYLNRTRNIVNNSNFIPTYQSLESLSATSSLATDDFYGLMDPLEGANAENSGVIDVGIGRFTCRSVQEVEAVIGKIENYYKKDPNILNSTSDPMNCSGASGSPMGSWRNNLLFLADDGDKAIHMKGADNLSTEVKGISKSYNSDKIYLDAYQRVSTPGGHRYPDASEDLVRKIRQGVMLFNYTGHGGEMGLTAERILDIATINDMDNFNKLPLFITATCEFSRYDDPGRTSAGELCLINAKGAAIALLTTCRLAYSSTNDLLNSVVMDKLFNRMSGGKRPALGDVIRMTKSSPLLGGQAFYYANFHLLGDPALTLSYPEYKVMTSKINNQPVGSFSQDTLSSLEKITVSGYVSDTLGNKLSNFNGLVYTTVYDKEQDVV
ncbi:MAG TPA: type IX secretion system sortase PorU, partial [Bacteroidia bacterium]|nr:type IX secretion system sortase PorU [Bacteroidia bacterium]